MYLAQRGPVENRYDYSRFAGTGTGEVFRYWRENPDDPATEINLGGMPQDYAVGFPQDNRQSAGGLDLQYGYDADGNLDATPAPRRWSSPPTNCATTLHLPNSSPAAGRSPCTAWRSRRRRWSSRPTCRLSALVRRLRRLFRRPRGRRPCRRRRSLASLRRPCRLLREMPGGGVPPCLGRGCASIPICRRGDRDRDCRPPVEKKVDLIAEQACPHPGLHGRWCLHLRDRHHQ